MEPSFYIPDDLPISTTETLVSAMVTRDVEVNIQLTSGSSGELKPPYHIINNFISLLSSSRYNKTSDTPNMFSTKPNNRYKLKAGSILTWVVGRGGFDKGGASSIYVDGELITGDSFVGENPVPGTQNLHSGCMFTDYDIGKSGLLQIW